MKWYSVADKKPPMDGRAVLFVKITSADDELIKPSTVSSVFMQIACWWAHEDDNDDGNWVVYCSMVQDPYLHFEPTHWADATALVKGLCATKLAPPSALGE